MSSNDILGRALSANQQKAKQFWKSDTRVQRYRPALPAKPPFVWKFYVYPPGQWCFVAAPTREEARKHPLCKPHEQVCKATLRDLNELAKMAIEAGGGTVFMGPLRMRSKTKGHQALRAQMIQEEPL